VTTVHLGLGSNVGDSRAHLEAAFRALDRLPRTRLLRRSSVHRTKAWGVRGQRDYLNAAAVIRTALRPMALLLRLKMIEASRGRRSGRRWAPRTLDLDILAYGALRLRTPFLVLPHPGRRRPFVAAPLAEVIE